MAILDGLDILFHKVGPEQLGKYVHRLFLDFFKADDIGAGFGKSTEHSRVRDCAAKKLL